MTTDLETKEVVTGKLVFAWGGWGFSKLLEMVGINSWGEFAAMCASIYSILLIIEWIWKKFKNLNKECPNDSQSH